MLNSLIRRLELKGKTFQTTDSATDGTIHDMFSVITEIHTTFTESDTTKDQLNNHPKLRKFLDHFCTSHYYLIGIKKCGEVPCPKGICKPTRLPEEVFKELYQFPDPVPQPDGHYRPFDEVLDSKTTEKHRPSLQVHGAIKAPFILKKENVSDIVKCMNCSKPRTVHSERKLSEEDAISLKL